MSMPTVWLEREWGEAAVLLIDGKKNYSFDVPSLLPIVTRTVT